jgi:hypothetical protein
MMRDGANCYQKLGERFSHCGPQTASEQKVLQQLNQTLNELKIHQYMSVLKLALFADLEQKVGELVPSIISCTSIIILENVILQKNVVIVTLTTGIMFLLFTCLQFWLCIILRRWSTCVPSAC